MNSVAELVRVWALVAIAIVALAGTARFGSRRDQLARDNSPA